MTAETHPIGEPHPRTVLLLLGCERSGTTLIQNTLAAHYAVAPGNESQWVVKTWPRLRRRPPLEPDAQEPFLRSIFADWYFANMANYHQVYFDHRDFLQDGPFDFPRFVEQVFRHIARVKEKSWVLNKTCVYCEHLDAVEEVFRRPRIVHLIRDGRDVGLSLLRTKSWGPKNAYAAGRYWASHVDGLQTHARELGDRYLEVRYEDLLADPEAAFERMTRFYGIHDPERHASLVAALQIRRDNSGKWRTAFSRRDLELFEAAAGASLLRNGYALASARGATPAPRPVAAAYRAHSAVASRVGLYPLWFRFLRIFNRVLGRFPRLQQRFYRSETFSKHFHWNRVLRRRGQPQ